jgi:hypothetical protein
MPKAQASSQTSRVAGPIHAVDFDTAKVRAGDGLGDRLVDLAFVALGMGDRKILLKMNRAIEGF